MNLVKDLNINILEKENNDVVKDLSFSKQKHKQKNNDGMFIYKVIEKIINVKHKDNINFEVQLLLRHII